MPKHVADRDTVVKPHKLNSYDQLTDTDTKTEMEGDKDET
jgi:hypothetical protein